jgi:hypothetical protein
MPKDYDGDGRADISIKYDNGRGRIDYASNGFGAFDQQSSSSEGQRGMMQGRGLRRLYEKRGRSS